MRRIEVSALSEVQQRAVMAPMTASVLVVGAPGTGKSVVLTQRAERAAQIARRLSPEQRVLCFARQTPLMVAIRRRLALSPEVTVGLMGDTLPLPAQNQDGDWGNGRYLLLDEAQDFELGELETVFAVGCPVTATVDDNQRTRLAEAPTRDQLELMLTRGERRSYVFELDRNYRNTPQIHAFASSFHFAKTVAKPSVNPGEGDLPEVVVTEAQGEALAARIAEIAAPFVGREVGIIVCGGSNREVETIAKQLGGLGVAPRHFVGSSAGGDAARRAREALAVALEPGDPGLKVIGKQWVKGLEFDVVIALHFSDLLRTSRNREVSSKNKGEAYIVASRARTHLFLVERTVERETVSQGKQRVAARLKDGDVSERRYKFR